MEKKANPAETDHLNNVSPLKRWVMPEIIQIGKDDISTHKKSSRFPTEYRETQGPHYNS